MIIFTSSFENYVNYAGSKTNAKIGPMLAVFENYVNYAGSKTKFDNLISSNVFENYVNYAGSKTKFFICHTHRRLRTM